MRYLNAAGTWPSGNVRYYYRPKGEKGTPMPDLPIDHPDFRIAHAQAEKAHSRDGEGSLSMAIRAFLGSQDYARRSDATRAVWRRALDDLRSRYGVVPLAKITPKSIRIDLARLEPYPARNRLKVWRALMKWAVRTGRIDANPAREVESPEAPALTGWTPWTRDDFAVFREFWPLDTPQRLAFELMHLSCAAISDAVRLGPGMIEAGWLTYTRRKSGSAATCPMTADAPAWFEPDGLFLDAWQAQPSRHMTYMVTAEGRPRSHKAAASWFSAAATKAGLPNLSAHGIRKGRAAIFRENGATEDQRMAILGHETEAEARDYSRSADLKRIVNGFQPESPNRSNLVKLSR